MINKDTDNKLAIYKLTSKDKKIIQKILKDPESVDRVGQVGTRVKDIERYIR